MLNFVNLLVAFLVNLEHVAVALGLFLGLGVELGRIEIPVKDDVAFAIIFETGTGNRDAGQVLETIEAERLEDRAGLVLSLQQITELVNGMLLDDRRIQQ